MDDDDSNDHSSGVTSSHPHDDDCGGSLLLLHSSSRRDNVASVERTNSAGSVESSSPLGRQPFFADMTLDYQLARMETTPRTDTKFASMAASSSSLMMLNLTPPVMPLTILDEELVEEEIMIDEEISNSHSINCYNTPSSDDDADDDDHVENSENNMDRLANTIRVNYDIIENSTIQQEEVVEENLHTSFNSSDQQQQTQQQQYIGLPYHRPSRPPRRPRDVSWMATALLIIPTGLIVPHVYYRRHSTNTNNTTSEDVNSSSSLSSWSDMVSSNSAHSTLLLSTLTALATSLIVLRLLYSHPGGSDGDNSRYKAIARSLLLANQYCIWLHVIQIGLIYHYLSNVRSAILLPIGLVIRDTLRKVTLATTIAQRHQFQQQRLAAATSATSTTHDRITFFLALAVSSLDVLSRSLRRTSFVRALSILLLIQFACTYLWWSALVTVLSSESMTATGSIVLTKVMHITWLLLVMIAGNWATSTVCHLLGYVSAGGVSAWFRGQQVSIMERLKMQQQQQEEQDNITTINAEGMNKGQTVWQDDDNAEDDYDDNAYQTADASAYATLSDFDEGLDDEYDDDEDPAEGVQYYDHRHQHHPQQQHINKEETVKSFLLVGCTIGFGSVAQCGLLGGVAQMFGTLVRIVDTNLPPLDEFRGMAVSTTVNDDTNAQRLRLIVSIQWRTTENAVRNFVRSHSDIAMSHVAVYFKSYQRAANDVATLIEISGKS